MEIQLYAFFTSALDGGESSASRSGCFTTRERATVTYLIGDLVSLRAGLEAVVKRKIPSPTGTRTTDLPARSIALYYCTNPSTSEFHVN
jgi:hypothetical protein